MILIGELLHGKEEGGCYLKYDEKRCLRNTPNGSDYSRSASGLKWVKDDIKGGRKGKEDRILGEGLRKGNRGDTGRTMNTKINVTK